MNGSIPSGDSQLPKASSTVAMAATSSGPRGRAWKNASATATKYMHHSA